MNLEPSVKIMTSITEAKRWIIVRDNGHRLIERNSCTVDEIAIAIMASVDGRITVPVMHDIQENII